MAKQELLTAVEVNDTTTFIGLLQRHGKKRSNVDLAEVLLELSRPQLDKLWTCVHAWTNDQLTKLLEEENVDQGPSAKAQAQTDGNVAPAEVNGVEGAPAEVNSAEGAPAEVNGVEGAPAEVNSAEGEPAEVNADNETEEMEVVQKEPYNGKLMAAILDLAYIYISSLNPKQNDAVPDKLLELAVLLQGMVTVFDRPVQTGIAALCMLWWQKELDEREHVIISVLPILIDEAIKSVKKKDVQKLWTLREALHMAPLETPDCQPLVEKLVACSRSPAILCCDEGIKWLANLFSWPFLVGRVHQGIKTMLPTNTRAQSGKLAEVYFRAWKSSQGAVKQMIEENCIQDLMYAAIHVDPMGRLSANLHHLLHCFHRHKKSAAVEDLIYNLYEPFLWRSLKAANGLVRMNAAGLLCDIFPMSESKMNKQESEAFKDKQYQTFISLLTDPCHLVRITAIKGVCNILNLYWLMIPAHIIKVIFQKFLSELLLDASSAEVRTQVIKGIILLLDCNDAVQFLKEVLPRLGDTFDDINVNVRVSFVKMMLKVKSMKVVCRFWDIVPMQHILHRLEEDKPTVCKLITQLLLSTFHPVHAEHEELMLRTLALLEENRPASRRFYQYASRKLDLHNNVQFILLILSCLRKHLRMQESLQEATNSSINEEETSNGGSSGSKSDKRSGSASKSGKRSLEEEIENKENRDDGENENDDSGASLDDPSIVCGLFDIIVIIWTTNAIRLAQNDKYLQALRTKVSKSMPLFFKTYKENEEISRTLLYLSSFLPRNLMPTIVGHCLSRLKGFQPDQEEDDSYTTYINALCNWNQVDDVLELALEWLDEAFKSGERSTSKEQRTEGRKVRFIERHTPQPLFALRLISYILEHPLNKMSTLKKNRHLLIQLVEKMEIMKRLICERLDQTEMLSDLCSDQFLTKCWNQYLKLVAVLHKPNESHDAQSQPQYDYDDDEQTEGCFDSSLVISTCMDWARSALFPTLDMDQGGKRKLRSGEEASELSIDALNDLLKCTTSLLVIGAASPTFAYQACAFADDLLKTDSSATFWSNCLLLAQESREYLAVYDPIEADVLEEGMCAPLQVLQTCVSAVSELFKQQENLPRGADDITSILGPVLVGFSQGSKPSQEAMFSFASSVISHLCWYIDRLKGVDNDVKTIKELGGGVSMLVGVCLNRAKLATAFMSGLTEVIRNIQDITSLLACSYLVKILIHDSGRISRYSLKEAVGAVDTVMASIILPSSIEEDQDQEPIMGLFEQYTKTSRDIINEMKDNLGVI